MGCARVGAWTVAALHKQAEGADETVVRGLARAVRDGDATLRRMRVDLSEKWRALLCRRRRGGRPMDEQRGGARDKKKQDNAQDGQGVQERRRNTEWVWA